MYTYRKALKTDLELITQLITDNLEINVKDKSAGFLQTPYASEHLGNTRIITNDKEILAIAIVREVDKEDEEDYNVTLPSSGKYLYSVCTNSKYRKQGIGSQLYKEILTEFANSNLYVAILLEPEPNSVSLSFHNALGFNLVGKCPWQGHVYGLYELKLKKT